jgi:hypothetical protein
MPMPISPSNGQMAVAGATALLTAFSIIPYIAVWAMPHTTADLLLLCIFALGLGAVAAIAKARELLIAPAVANYPRVP